MNTSPSETLPKYWRWGNTSELILWGQYYSDTKIRQRYYKKRKLETNILDGYWWKPLSKIPGNRIQHLERIVRIMTKWNLYPDARRAEHTKCRPHHTAQQQNQGQKPHNYLNAEQASDKTQSPFTIKTPNTLGPKETTSTWGKAHSNATLGGRNLRALHSDGGQGRMLLLLSFSPRRWRPWPGQAGKEKKNTSEGTKTSIHG